jgi:putative NIF3 family GTP cyclohydrolase 1 type 2
MESIRVVGNPEMEFTKVGYAAGAPGGQNQIGKLRNPEVEVLITGESSEWETYSYTNDAAAQGRNKAVIFLGHIKSEEAGMEFCVEWLKGFASGVPIIFIENKANFTEL